MCSLRDRRPDTESRVHFNTGGDRAVLLLIRFGSASLVQASGDVARPPLQSPCTRLARTPTCRVSGLTRTSHVSLPLPAGDTSVLVIVEDQCAGSRAASRIYVYIPYIFFLVKNRSKFYVRNSVKEGQAGQREEGGSWR